MAIPREPVVELQRRLDRPGTPVLDRLRRARAADGQLTPESIDAVAAELGLPRAHVHGAATFFEEIGLRRRGQRHVQVCAGTACFAVTGGRHVSAVERHLGLSRGECRPDGSVSLQPVYCLGYCFGGPAVLDNEQACVGPDLVDQLSGAVERRDPEIPAYSAVDRPVLLAGVLRGEPAWQVWPDVVRARGGAAVIAEVAASGLRGRGGAGFPASHKWSAAAAAPTPGPRFVVVNGDEGDPGSYIDRLLLQRDPHRVLEGTALAGLASGATRGYIYVRSEYPAARDRMREAVEEARAAGHLGEDVHGSGFSFDVEVVEGAGSYVAGEETSLIHSMEGLRGSTLARPPFPTSSGLFTYPTVVNNVESIATVPWIVANGGAAYSALGHGHEHGQRLVCVNATFARPGVYEVPLGIPLRVIVEDLAGGLTEGRRLRSLQIGGPLGGLLPPDRLDVPLSAPALAAEGVALGHASLLAFDDSIPGRSIMRHLWRFAAAESCGTCSPCRIGSRRGLDLSRRGDLTGVGEVCDTMAATSLCAFGPGIAQAARSVMRVYADEFGRPGAGR